MVSSYLTSVSAHQWEPTQSVPVYLPGWVMATPGSAVSRVGQVLGVGAEGGGGVSGLVGAGGGSGGDPGVVEQVDVAGPVDQRGAGGEGVAVDERGGDPAGPAGAVPLGEGAAGVDGAGHEQPAGAVAGDPGVGEVEVVLVDLDDGGVAHAQDVFGATGGGLQDDGLARTRCCRRCRRWPSGSPHRIRWARGRRCSGRRGHQSSASAPGRPGSRWRWCGCRCRGRPAARRPGSAGLVRCPVRQPERLPGRFQPSKLQAAAAAKHLMATRFMGGGPFRGGTGSTTRDEAAEPGGRSTAVPTTGGQHANPQKVSASGVPAPVRLGVRSASQAAFKDGWPSFVQVFEAGLAVVRWRPSFPGHPFAL